MLLSSEILCAHIPCAHQSFHLPLSVYPWPDDFSRFCPPFSAQSRTALRKASSCLIVTRIPCFINTSEWESNVGVASNHSVCAVVVWHQKWWDMKYLFKARIISAFHMCPFEIFVPSPETQNEVTALKIIVLQFVHLMAQMVVSICLFIPPFFFCPKTQTEKFLLECFIVLKPW